MVEPNVCKTHHVALVSRTARPKFTSMQGEAQKRPYLKEDLGRFIAQLWKELDLCWAWQ